MHKINKLLGSTLCCFLFAFTLSAQVIVGTGTTITSTNPITSCYGYTYSEQVYTQAEINTSGSITSISFYFDSSTATANDESDDWTIYLGHTTQTSYASTTDWIGAGAMTQVFSGIITYPAVGNWMTITLTTPFAYNNTDNLVVGIDENAAGWDCTHSWQGSSTAPNNTAIYYRNDSTNPDPLAPPTATGTSATRPNVIFGGIVQSCPTPSALTASNVTSTSADLGWTENGTATTWIVEYGTAGFTLGAGTTVVVTGNPYTLAGLTANTAYEYYVQADCGTSGTSLWAGPFAFSTECAIFTAPYLENFDNASTIPNCWAQGAANAEDWFFVNNAGHGGNAGNIVDHTSGTGNFAWVDDSAPDSNGTTLESPMVDVSALTTPILSFWINSDNEGNSNVNFSVDLWDGAAWNTAIFTSNSNTNGWLEVVIDLSVYTISGPVQVRFIVDEIVVADFYDDFAIDDVRIDEFTTCIAPSTLITSNTTANSADLGWTEVGTATAWNIEWGLAEFTATGTPSIVGTSTNPHNLTGLTPNTTYEFYVQANCGNELSYWTGPFEFTTLCTTVTMSCAAAYEQNFDELDNSLNCWPVGGGPATGPTGATTGGGWYLDNFANGSTSQGIIINLWDLGTEDWVLSPEFDLSAGGSYQLTFDLALTNWDDTTAGFLGSDDQVQLLISTDGGTTWISLETWDNTSVISNTGEVKTYDLTTYASSTSVIFGLWATEGTVDDLEDMEFHVDNFTLECTGGNPCVDGYEGMTNQLTGPLTASADYETDQGIDSDQIISGTGVGVDYDAGIDIDLLPGFEVMLGVEFDAFIDGCAGGTSDGAGGNQ